MNVFGDLSRPITQRPGDPRDRMSYGDAMALRDRHRSGQPVDKDKLAEADRIVKATRAKVFTPSTDDEVQEQPQAAGDAGAAQNSRSDTDMQPQPKERDCVVNAAPDTMMAEMIANVAAAQAAKEYHPRAGSLPWKVYRHLKRHPEALTRVQIAEFFHVPVNGLDTSLELAVSRGALVRARNSKMELTWALGPSQNVVIDEEIVIPKFTGRVEPALKLVAPAQDQPEPAPVLANASTPEGVTSKPPEGKREAKLERLRSEIEAEMEPRADRGNRLLLDKLKTSLPHWDGAATGPEPQPSVALAPLQREEVVASAPAPRTQTVPIAAPAQADSQNSRAAHAPCTDSTANAESLEALEGALEPISMMEAIERNLWSEGYDLEKRWIKFFDAFEVGDHIEVDEANTPELCGWRSFYREKTWEYADGVRLFTIYPKREGVYGMVRVL